MDNALRQQVRARAGDRCEYCRLPQAGHDERFSVDHVVARKHGGADALENLALCCLRCNLHKGTDLTTLDPLTSTATELFNPRRQRWGDHFAWNGPLIVGVTSTGRATVALLQMNRPERVRLRQALLDEGLLL